MIKNSIKVTTLALASILVAALAPASVTAEDIVLDAKLPEFQPVRSADPVYPKRAMDRKISGYALVEYTIKENGRTNNIKVVDSQPKKIFDIPSKKAIQRTVYDKADAATVQGDTFYKLYVYELDTTNANRLASNQF